MRLKSASTILAAFAVVFGMSYAIAAQGAVSKPDGSDWLYVDHDLAGTRYSPLKRGVVTYNARGVQNVAIVSGFVGIYNMIAPEIGGSNTTVTIFRLRGK